MASAVGNLFVNIRGRTAAFGADMKKAGGMVKGFGALVATTSKQMLVMFAPLAGIAGFVKLIKASEDFNKAMNSSIAIMKDVSKVMREDMTAAALKVSRTTVFSAAQAAKAYFFLASAGFDATESLEAMPIVATFAQAGMFDLATATDLLTDAQSALGLNIGTTAQKMANMKRIGNVLVKANTLANASVEQFSEGLTGKLGPRIKALGKDVEEATALLAAFADQGIKGADASTAAAIVMRDLSSKAILNAAAFRRAGIAVFDTAEEMRAMPDIIADVEKRLDRMSDRSKLSELSMLGLTDKSVGYTLALVGTSKAMGENLAKLRDAGNVMEDVAGQQMTPLQTAWEGVKASFEGIGIQLAPMIKVFASLVTAIDEAIQKLRDYEDASDLAFGNAKTAFDILAAFTTLPDAVPPVPGVDTAPTVAPTTAQEIADFNFNKLTDMQKVERELREEADAKALKDGIKARTKAQKLFADVMKRTTADMKRAVANYEMSLRKPSEVLRDEWAKLNRLRIGGLSDEFFNRGIDALQDKFGGKDFKGETATTLQAGSEGAVRAIIRAQFGGSPGTVEEKQLAEQKAMNRKLAEIAKRKRPPTLVATIPP